MHDTLDLNYGRVPFAAIDFQPLCCLSFTARETDPYKPGQLLQFPAAAPSGWQDREGLGWQSQHSCIRPWVPKSLLTPVSVLKLGRIALPSPPNEASALRERKKSAIAKKHWAAKVIICFGRCSASKVPGESVWML